MGKCDAVAGVASRNNAVKRICSSPNDRSEVVEAADPQEMARLSFVQEWNSPGKDFFRDFFSNAEISADSEPVEVKRVCEFGAARAQVFEMGSLNYSEEGLVCAARAE